MIRSVCVVGLSRAMDSNTVSTLHKLKSYKTFFFLKLKKKKPLQNNKSTPKKTEHKGQQCIRTEHVAVFSSEK